MRTCLLLTASLGCLIALAAPSAPEAISTPDWLVQPAANLSRPRAAHKATAISPNLVLVTGGCSGTGCTPVERSAELLHIGTGRSEMIRPMSEARAAHVAALLKDGRVLVAGGWTGDRTTASAEVFDPQTLSFSRAGAMATARMDATATPLLDGSVLVVGGAIATNRFISEAEIFDPTKSRFVAAGRMREARAHHTVVRLRDGRVLVIGGQTGRNVATSSAEIYDPAANTFTVTGAMRQPRSKHSAVLLKDGRVMVIGGSSDGDYRRSIAQTEIYDPRTGQFTAGPSLLNPRFKIIDAATVLPSGEVVVAGGANAVEVWTPGTPGFVKASGSIGKSLSFSTATPLSDGSVLILGGYDSGIRVTAQAWVVKRIRSAGSPR